MSDKRMLAVKLFLVAKSAELQDGENSKAMAVERALEKVLYGDPSRSGERSRRRVSAARSDLQRLGLKVAMLRELPLREAVLRQKVAELRSKLAEGESIYDRLTKGAKDLYSKFVSGSGDTYLKAKFDSLSDYVKKKLEDPKTRAATTALLGAAAGGAGAVGLEALSGRDRKRYLNALLMGAGGGAMVGGAYGALSSNKSSDEAKPPVTPPGATMSDAVAAEYEKMLKTIQDLPPEEQQRYMKAWKDKYNADPNYWFPGLGAASGAVWGGASHLRNVARDRAGRAFDAKMLDELGQVNQRALKLPPKRTQAIEYIDSQGKTHSGFGSRADATSIQQKQIARNTAIARRPAKINPRTTAKTLGGAITGYLGDAAYRWANANVIPEWMNRSHPDAKWLGSDQTKTGPSIIDEVIAASKGNAGSVGGAASAAGSYGSQAGSAFLDEVGAKYQDAYSEQAKRIRDAAAGLGATAGDIGRQVSESADTHRLW